MQNIQLIAQNFLSNLQTGNEVSDDLATLRKLDRGELIRSLATDDEKKAFWINLYNAFNFHFLLQNPQFTLDPDQRKAHFETRKLELAGWKLSMDTIEHGILRRSKVKVALGYMQNWFPSGMELKLRVQKLDYRIHFALNCGGKSCPPVRFYSPERINQELAISTSSFLHQSYSWAAEDRKTLYLSKLFLWYHKDFGGKNGILGLLREHGILHPDEKPNLRYLDYSWDPDLNPFAN